jgi:drug/metabolite transporter (DMT)-like permease
MRFTKLMARRSFPDPAHVLLGVTVTVWAGAFAAIKQLIDDGMPAPDIAVARYLVAAPGFAVALWLTGSLRGATRRELARVLAGGLAVVSVYHLALNQGERSATAGMAAVIVASAPGITLAMSVGLGLERFSHRRAGGLVLAFLGVVVVVLLGAGESVTASGPRGPLLVLVAAASFAAYNVLTKPLLARHSPIAVASAASLAGTLALLPLAGRSTLQAVSGMGAGRWLLVLYLGTVCTLAAYIAWTMALRRVDPSRAVSFLYSIPVLGVAIGAVTLGEPLTPWLVAGGGMIVGGVVLAQ